MYGRQKQSHLQHKPLCPRTRFAPQACVLLPNVRSFNVALMVVLLHERVRAISPSAAIV